MLAFKLLEDQSPAPTAPQGAQGLHPNTKMFSNCFKQGSSSHEQQRQDKHILRVTRSQEALMEIQKQKKALCVLGASQGC